MTGLSSYVKQSLRNTNSVSENNGCLFVCESGGEGLFAKRSVYVITKVITKFSFFDMFRGS